MILHTIGTRIARDLDGIIEGNRLSTGPVVLNWTSRTLPGDYDRNVEGSYPATVPHTLTVTALIHYVNAATKMVNFLEFQAGDAIVTFNAEVALDGLDNLTFTLPDGRVYVPSQVGKKVTEFWDVVVQGRQLARTIALRVQ